MSRIGPHRRLGQSATSAFPLCEEDQNLEHPASLSEHSGAEGDQNRTYKKIDLALQALIANLQDRRCKDKGQQTMPSSRQRRKNYDGSQMILWGSLRRCSQRKGAPEEGQCFWVGYAGDEPARIC